MTRETAIEKNPARTVDVRTRPGRSTAWTYRPNVDIFDTPDELVLQADLPGARADSVDVSVEQGVLTLQAQLEPRQPVEGERPLLQEYGVGSFHRRFEIDESIETEQIRADYRDGVLTVHLPKSTHGRRRRIPVTTAG